MAANKSDAHGAGAEKPAGSRKRILLVAELTPAWAETIHALQENQEKAEVDLIAPTTTPADLADRLRHDEAEALVVVVDLGADSIRRMSTVVACRHLAPAVPVIVVAANPSQELARRIRLSGVFYLALDPVGAEEMRNVLDNAFGCAARQQSRTSTCRDKQKILIIDDDSDYLASTSALLRAEGYSVSTAMSGTEGLARTAGEPPDLIVLDIMMENEWAGYEVNQRIKFGNDFECIRHVPILMVSSIAVDPVSRFSRAGEVDMITPDAYLTKPLDLPRFLAAVRALLGERQAEAVK
jgi:CheY-like chemotaxis protein/AmiR/NasT family two-component response regulator